MIRHLVPALLIAIAAPAVLAAPNLAVFEGRVVRVKDGDSLMVERQDVKRTSEIRMAGIDAPELAQPWGIQSRSALRRMVQGQRVRVEVTDRDAYGRLVGKVWAGRTYVNAAMTEQGHAWAFSRYMRDSRIRAGQDSARKAGRGLWRLAEKDRVPPATWRDRNPRQD